jgi:polyisoprenoid-binding protein YceI
MQRARARRSCASTILLAILLLFSVVLPLRGKGMQSQADNAVDYSASYLVAITSTTGLFAFAGHRHAILASAWSADLQVNPDDLSRATAVITLPTDKLVVDTPAARQKAGLGKGPGESDVRVIQQRMLGSEVLDAARYPQIRFTATAIKAQGSGQMQISGNMQIQGRLHPVDVQVRRRSQGQQTAFDGEFNIQQTDYGLKPESVAGGTVKVKDTITIKFHIVTRAGQ